jgi:hypothetical protein
MPRVIVFGSSSKTRAAAQRAAEQRADLAQELEE